MHATVAVPKEMNIYIYQKDGRVCVVLDFHKEVSKRKRKKYTCLAIWCIKKLKRL